MRVSVISLVREKHNVASRVSRTCGDRARRSQGYS